MVLIFSGFFGFILAELEGWKDIDGFYYVTSMLCGLPTPLTDVTPTTDEGKFIDIVIAIWSWALIGTVIGVVGSMSIISQIVQTAEDSGKIVINAARRVGRRAAVLMKRSGGGDVIHPTDEGETENERAAVKHDNLEDVGAGGGGGGDMTALTRRIASVESTLSKQTRMLENLVAASKAAS